MNRWINERITKTDDFDRLVCECERDGGSGGWTVSDF